MPVMPQGRVTGSLRAKGSQAWLCAGERLTAMDGLVPPLWRVPDKKQRMQLLWKGSLKMKHLPVIIDEDGNEHATCHCDWDFTDPRCVALNESVRMTNDMQRNYDTMFAEVMRTVCRWANFLDLPVEPPKQTKLNRILFGVKK
jgi:hypothetical protein